MNNYVLDTCAAIKIVDNPNFLSMLSCRLNLKNSRIILCSQMIFEFHKNGFDLDILVKILESVQTKVDFKRCTYKIHQKAIYLESLCNSLHSGDSEILAIAYDKKFDLISCDKGLVNAAKQFNIKNVNPHMMISNIDTKRSRTSYFATVKKVIQEKKKQVVNTPSTLLKPGQKIIWRSFN